MVAVDPKFSFVESHTKVIFQSVSFVISESNGNRTVNRFFCQQANENPKSSDSRYVSHQRR